MDFYQSIGYFFPHATHHVTWRKPTAELPGYFEIIPYKIGRINRNNYRGRVVVLANEQTQSRAEYMTMALQSLSSTIVVGSQTAGADGDIVVIPLPREIITLFSGLGVYYPDGTNTQRTGIRIDHYVTHTIEGIRASRDEILEKAMKIIESSH